MALRVLCVCSVSSSFWRGSTLTDLSLWVGHVELLYQLVWSEEFVPPQWREGLIVNLFKKGDMEKPGNYRGITLLSVVGKVWWGSFLY